MCSFLLQSPWSCPECNDGETLRKHSNTVGRPSASILTAWTTWTFRVSMTQLILNILEYTMTSRGTLTERGTLLLCYNDECCDVVIIDICDTELATRPPISWGDPTPWVTAREGPTHHERNCYCVDFVLCDQAEISETVIFAALSYSKLGHPQFSFNFTTSFATSCSILSVPFGLVTVRSVDLLLPFMFL